MSSESYHNIWGRAARPPTAWERQQERLRREAGTEDVYVSPDAAPPEFWEAVLIAVEHEMATIDGLASKLGTQWWDEYRWSRGLPAYDQRRVPELFKGCFPTTASSRATAVDAMSAVEHLADIKGYQPRFAALLDNAARRFRVGLKFGTDCRFIELTSEHLHSEVVQPALKLLSDPRLEQANELYRKAFDRMLTGDSSGAITAAMSAVEEALRGFGAEGATLADLAYSGQKRGSFGPGVAEAIKKLNAYRGDADAHKAGTDESPLAWLVVHECAALIVFLGRN